MMRQRSDQVFLLTLSLMDAFVCASAWVMAYVVRWETNWIPANEVTIPPWWWCIRTIPLVICCAWCSFHACGMYQLRRRWSLSVEIFKTFQALALTLLLILAVTFYSRNPYESRMASVFFFAFALVGVVLFRRSLGLYFKLCRRSGKMRRTALIIGTGRTARAVEEVLRRNNWLGIQPVGFVDDLDPRPKRSVMTVGKIDDLSRLVDQHSISYVFVAPPSPTIRREQANLPTTFWNARRYSTCT